jgi:hypothetical protein
MSRSHNELGDVLSGMQFGVFTVGDVTEDPTTGHAPAEAERIHATVTIAKKAERVSSTTRSAVWTASMHTRVFEFVRAARAWIWLLIDRGGDDQDREGGVTGGVGP